MLGAMTSAAGAQAPPSPKTPPQPSAPPTVSQGGACTSRSTDGNTTGQSSQPLAEKLAKSDGVLCPPSGVDPEIRAPAPDVGTMPVIPPPGTPGGDPTVRPK